MAGDDDVRPTPDPTVLTTQSQARAVASLRDYVDGRISVHEERLRGIDRATELLNETVNRVPTDVQKEVGHLGGLMTERFQSVQVQFSERDTRQERESRDNKIAVDAAFAAQKEIAAKQDESNARALEKSEKSTEKWVDTLGEKVDDLKDRINSLDARIVAIETSKTTTRETKADSSAGDSRLVALLGLLLLALSVAFAIYAATRR